MILGISSIFVIVFSLFVFSAGNTDNFKLLTLSLLSFCALLSALFFIRRESCLNLRGQYVRHSVLFLVGVLVVHFQTPLDYLLGNFTALEKIIRVNDDVIFRTLCYSATGLASFFFGYVAFENIYIGKCITSSYPERIIPTKPLVWLAMVLLIFYFATVNPLYLKGYYGAAKIGRTASYVILLFKSVVFAVFIQNWRNSVGKGVLPLSLWRYVCQQDLLLLFLIFIYLSSVMLSGDRGPLMTFGVAFFSGYLFLTKKKLNYQC